MPSSDSTCIDLNIGDGLIPAHPDTSAVYLVSFCLPFTLLNAVEKWRCELKPAASEALAGVTENQDLVGR